MAIFVLLALSFGLLLHGAGGVNEEGRALLRFRSSAVEDGDVAMANWNSSDPSPCSWNGVTCRNQAVIAITLPKAKLRGSLSPFLGNLSSLRHLNLRGNDLHGAIPPVIFSGALGLQSLILSGNSLSGTLPSSIGGLLYLQILDISGNAVAGALPASLTACRRLRALDLAGNNFSGGLPAGFGGAFPLLEKLNLSFNSLSSQIPDDLGELVSLQGTVDLSHNRFSGAVPASLGDLPEKVFIDLSYNNLSGEIPQTGSLAHRGPAAFIGNPTLCGPPLKTLCASSLSSSSSGGSVRRGLNGGEVAAIIAGDLAAVALMALIFLFCYRRALTAVAGAGEEKECLCLHKEKPEPPSKLEFLDHHASFDLEELLKSSAFVLGKSEMGILYKVELEDGLAMAVRRLGEGGSQRFREFQAEVEAIGEIRHINIVPLRAYYWSSEEKLLIYDYIPCGNLSAAVHGEHPAAPPMPWKARMKIMKGIARGMAFLHEFSPKKYVHGDLKPSNVLLGRDLEPFIADFGLRRLADISSPTPEKTTEKRLAGRWDYRAPESVKEGSRPSQKWDVYSYGVIALEMITGRSPAATMSAAGVGLVRWVQLCVEEKKPLGELLDPILLEEEEAEVEKEEEEIVGALKIALSCVQSRPERRPSMRHVVDSIERL